MDTDIDTETIDAIKVNGQKNEKIKRKKRLKIGVYQYTYVHK